MDNPIIGSLLTIILVFLNAFFVAAEFAIVKVRASQIELLASTGKRTALVAQNIIAHLDEYLSATQLGITIASLGLGWIGESIVSEILIWFFHLIGIAISPDSIHRVALPVAFLSITVLHIVVGELAPKSLAIQYAERTTMVIALPLRLFYIVFRPLIKAMNFMAGLVLRIFGIQLASEATHFHSGKELRLLLEQGREGGTIEQSEHDLIEKVFEFSDTVVKEVMVPRIHIAALDLDAAPDDLVKTVLEEGYTRMPVFKDTIDNIIGVVYSKDLITLLEHRNLILLQDLLRPVTFIPETKPISELLREFQRSKNHLAIVVDEFGGTAGLVTMEDVLEELVGEIQDEYDEEITGVEPIGDGAYLVSAALSINDVNEHLKGIQLPEGEDYTTIAGLVNKWFGHIPEVNESYERDGVRMTVLNTDSNRVVQVRIEDLNLETSDTGIHAFDADGDSGGETPK